jgi:electron transfer flavoprotein alpha subunit
MKEGATNSDAVAEGQGIWVVAEDAGEDSADLALALVCEARKLASRLGPVSILMAGPAAGSPAARAGHYGADQALVVGGANVANPSPRSLAHLFANPIRTHAPRLLLFPATRKSAEIAGLVAARLDLPLVTNSVRLNADEQGRILVTKPWHGGRLHRTFTADPGLPLLVTMNEGAAALERPDRSRRIALIDIPCDATSEATDAVRIVDVVDQSPATQDVADARVVIGCGRGLGHRDNLRLLEELAELLGGTIGGTRAAVDAGWIPFAKQIGQTGKTIAPRLYIACGISGASHHLAGVQDAKLIVAINNDRNAQIFKMADIAVVGDVLDVVPEMIAAIRNDQAAKILEPKTRTPSCASGTTP